MANKPFESGKITPVFHQIGYDANREPRYRQAMYSVLDWAENEAEQSRQYMLTGRVTLPSDVELNSDKSAEQMGQEFGFCKLPPLLIEPYLADGAGDGVLRLNFVGYV